MLTPAQLENLKAAAQDAVACEKLTELPAELTVAQWALESGWGAHQPGNNCFGIKAYPGCFGIQSLETIEIVGNVRVKSAKAFASFPSLKACFQKHAALICEGMSYNVLWARYLQSRDVTALVKDVAAVYATDPAYAQKLLAVTRMSAVEGAIAAARA